MGNGNVAVFTQHVKVTIKRLISVLTCQIVQRYPSQEPYVKDIYKTNKQTHRRKFEKS